MNSAIFVWRSSPYSNLNTTLGKDTDANIDCFCTVDQALGIRGQICQDPGEVAGATRDVTRGPYPVGTVIRYYCIAGVGGTITCQTNGQWTQKPRCTFAGIGMNCNFCI